MTGRFAVSDGVYEPRSSSAIGNEISTSNAASPRTRTRQPVGEQIPRRLEIVGAVPVRGEAHDLVAAAQPDDGGPLRADRAGGELAGHDRRVAAYRRNLARGRPFVDGTARGRGQHSERGPELAEEVLRPPRVIGIDGPAETHQREQQVRRVAARQIRELLDRHRLDVALHRQERERQRVGDESGAAAGRVDRGTAARARVEHTRAPLVAQRLPARERTRRAS